MARGVGTMPRPLRVTSGSPSASRRRARALLTADGVTCRRPAARATFCSRSTTWSMSIRLRSIEERLTDGELTYHESSLPELVLGTQASGHAEVDSLVRHRRGRAGRISLVIGLDRVVGSSKDCSYVHNSSCRIPPSCRRSRFVHLLSRDGFGRADGVPARQPDLLVRVAEGAPAAV